MRETGNKKAVLSQGEPRGAAVNFDTYWILQRRRVISLSQHGFLVYISDRSNAEIIHYTQSANFHGRDAKSRHRTKITAKVMVIVNAW